MYLISINLLLWSTLYKIKYVLHVHLHSYSTFKVNSYIMMYVKLRFLHISKNTSDTIPFYTLVNWHLKNNCQK